MKPWIGARTYRVVRTVHKWAGLAACVWLFVLGATGVVLDHHEWRWVNQVALPSSLTSERVGMLVPGTVMRHIAVNAADPDHLLGASERGTWWSADRGATWTPITFQDSDGTPQVHRFVGTGSGRLDGLLLATDDGIWITQGDGRLARRVALEGRDVTALSAGATDRELVAVIDQSRILRVDRTTGAATDVNAVADVTGLTETVPFYRFVMDLHFGRGLLPGSAGILLNDLGGVAMAVLALTGLFYWWTTRRRGRRRLALKTRRGAMRWLYRAHGPVIGLLGCVPILYLSATAIPMNHIFGFIDWSRDKTVARASLPPVYQARSLSHEITGVVGWPGEPDRLSIATRFGLLESSDGGQSWRVNDGLPMERGTHGASLFRVDDRIFATFGGGRNFWRTAAADRWHTIDGPSRAPTSAARVGDRWYVKNSRTIFTGTLDGRADAPPLEDSRIGFAHAASGTPAFLFIADIHIGLIIHEQFRWANDVFAALALILAISGPLAWARTRWM